MSDISKLKTFFESLNSAVSISEIEVLLRDLLNCSLSLHSFWNTPVPLESFAAFFGKISQEFPNPNILLDGDFLVNKDRLVCSIDLGDRLLGAIDMNLSSTSAKDLLSVVLPVIALKMSNMSLDEKITKSLNFNNAMKNIAKIIESQYELNYIIPIIGEILDTFIENHLIYIFLKQGNKMKLVWPASCLDNKITQRISKLNSSKDLYFSKNHKTAYFPLISENTCVGYIVAKSTDNEILAQEVVYLEELAKQTATTITRAKVYGEILKYATLDALTGFYNRRQLDERVKQEVSHSKRKKVPLCAIMADIDYFKHVNDSYGHAAGDLVLKTIAKIMRTQLREYDIAARYGGEEFVILLPYTSSDEAFHVAERLRQAVSDKVIDIEKVNSKDGTKTINVSISIGICSYNEDWKPEEFIMNADKALYQAKDTGRNRIVFYGENN